MPEVLFIDINSLIQSTEFSLLAALLLGCLVALNPCQAAICLSALTVMADNPQAREKFSKKTFLFAAGRMTTYFLLGTVIYIVAKLTGLDAKVFYSTGVSELVEEIMPFLLIALAVFFLFRALHNHHHGDNCHNSRTTIKNHKRNGAFVLGMVLACIFCPESAVFFFGMLMPMSIASQWGIALIAAFAVAAVLPLVVIALICRLAADKSSEWELKLEKLQVKINIISAVLLFAMAVALFLLK